PWGSRGGKWETPPQGPAAVQFRSLVSGHTPQNRRFWLKCAFFQLSWGVSAVGSARSRASCGKPGPKIFRDPAVTPANQPAEPAPGLLHWAPWLGGSTSAASELHDP